QRPTEETAGRALRPERQNQPDREDDARQGNSRRPGDEAAAWHDLGQTGGVDPRRDQGEGVLPQRFLAAAASQPSGRRHALPAGRNQAAAATAAVRSRFRYSGTISA